MLYWFHLNAYILKMYALYILQCKWLLRSKLALFVIVDSYLILNKNNRQFLKKFWIRRNFISVQSVVNVLNKSSKNRFRRNVNELEWSEHCLTSGIFFTLPPSNCRIFVSTQLNFSTEIGFFVIESFFSYRIFGNILDCLKYWYLTASYCVCE